MSISLIRITGLEHFPSSFTVFRMPLSIYPDNSPVLSIQGGIPWINEREEADYGFLIRYSTYADFIAGLDFIFSYKAARRSKVTRLFLPYLPGARQDKPREMDTLADEATGDVLATLHFTAKMIAAVGITDVYTLDPHSPKADEVFADVGINLHAQMPTKAYTWLSRTNKYDGVIAPDTGAANRALEVAKQLGVPLLFGQKTRDPATNELSAFRIGGLHRDENYLLVDDICDGGGTFLGLGKPIYEAGASADLFVTHGLFTKGAAHRLRTTYFENLYTTDSLEHAADGVTTIPVVESMFRLSTDRPITYTNLEEGRR